MTHLRCDVFSSRQRRASSPPKDSSRQRLWIIYILCDNMGTFFYHRTAHRSVFMEHSLACSRIFQALFFLLLTSMPSGNNAQAPRRFPPLFNAALERPVLTNPTSSTCGGPAMEAYCLSSTSVESINRCLQGYCKNTCLGRSALPEAFNMLLAIPGADGCVEADTINVRPGSSPGNFSTVFKRQGTNCFLAPTASPRLDASGAVSFTLSVWVWLDSQLPGTLLEKQSSNGDVLFTLQVSTSGVVLDYSLFSSDIIPLRFNVAIAHQQWTHLALQVHDVSASIFINGPGSNMAATTTVNLVRPVSDTVGTYRVGQNKNGTIQFVGRIQDFIIYTVALSNREISQLYTGVLPTVRIKSECQCPSTYPREKPGQTLWCIKNGVIPDTADTTRRISIEVHPLELINDGDSNTMWISISQNNVEIDVDLGDQFQVFYVVMQFYSPFPKAVTILRQKDSNSSFQVWQYYADDCSKFGLPNNGPYSAPDSINCLQFGSYGAPIPYSLGNITFSLLAADPVARPGSTDFYNTPELHEFVRATKVRIRFEDHYYATATDYRHMYYSLFELIVTAWCDCNGHASQCNTTSLPYTCQCLADSFTQGARCERCMPLYNNKPFRKGDNLQAYPCQPCQCYGHADSCIYNSTLDPFPQSPSQGGGGVCVNCKHYTTGQFCETCIKYYFRPSGVSLYDINVCQACDCYTPGLSSTETDCARVDGQCGCKTNVEGRRCDTCKSGFYSLSETDPLGCSPCNCNPIGVASGAISCNQLTGQCMCKPNVRGIRCDECQYGFYGLSANNTAGCTACDCNPSGSTSPNCNPNSGQCICKDRVEGLKCDRCKDGFFNFTSDCIPCNCNPLGSESGTVCDKTQGQCVCKKNVKGLGCNQCQEGTFNFGSSAVFGCSECVCVLSGTVNGTGTCNTTSGNCICKANVEGQDCSRCKANTWGLNATDPLGCQPCNCDSTGTVSAALSICDANTGQCSCLSNRQGRRCDTCARGYYINPTGGCLLCPCYAPGTLSGTFCDAVSGQCECKERFGVTGQQCNQCLPTYYAFDTRNGICTPCNCLAAGSLNNTCNAVTGQCQCKTFVEGLPCDRCKTGTSYLDANNPYGCSTSPSQQPAPDLINRTSTSFYFSWRRPDSPNGIINSYSIYRNNTMIGNNTADNTSYQDSNLLPFTYYSYMVEVRNSFGSSRSPAVIFQTLAGNPSGDMILSVTDIRARSAMCSWSPPTNLNGPLLKYMILSRKNGANTTSIEWEGTSLSVMLTTLSPYARYSLIPRACTVGGCTDSSPVQIVTLSAAPEGQQAPNVTAVSSSELFVSWLPPLFPNGVIIFYELWFRGPQGADGAYTPPASRIFHPSGRYDPLALSGGNPLEPPATSYSVTNLLPFTMYEFQVYSENDVSKTASPWVSGRTKEAAPKYLAPPTVTGISSSSLSITWTVPRPEDMQGIVERYRLYENNATDLTLFPYSPPNVWVKIFDSDSSSLSFVRNGLTPYSTHTFYLEACNSQGCVNSTSVAGRTLLAAPEGVQRPQVDGFNTTVMQITWKPPLYPNGPPPNYKVEKTNIALSYPASVIRGTRFTGGGYYSFSPNVIPQSVAFTGIRLRFRLDQGTGLLLFTATSTQEEFLAVQFVNGRPRFMFDTQGCTNIAFITTTNDEGLVYNDRKWHTFEARREGVFGEVTVDSKWKGQSNIRDTTCQDTSIIGPTTGVFVGGFPAEFILRRTDNTRRVETTPLQGCIDNVEILTQKYPDEVWTKLDWTQGVTNDLAFLNWQGCPINLDPGFHFMGKGYLMLSHCTDKLVCIATGDRIEIRFRMRTTLHTGLLFLIYGGNGIYMYSVLDNGRLRFMISNNNNNTMVVYDKTDSSLCDGKWRLLIFSKIGQQASISIPTEKNVSVGDPNVGMNLPLTSEINLGGIKPGSNAMKYVQQNGLLIPGEGFGGCFSGFAINVKEYPTDMTLLDVANTNLDGCPPYHDAETTCQSSLITQIYNGTDTVAYDRGLLPYTDYIYRVVASNSAGEGYSSWAYGRTREGAPSGVKGPVSVRPISGNEVEVIWQEPEITYGLLTKFIIMAYVSNSKNQSVSMDILDVTLTAANMTGVIPDTTYLIKMKACTPGGCTESPDGMQVTMPVEAPENVSAPTADPGPTFLFVKWTLPAKPNGPITGFFLYQEGSEIYKGGQLSYNVTGLQVYTAYRFYVSACTTAGCTNGPSVALSTSQLPPTAVGQPKLTVLGTSQIQVTWDPPSQLNGVLVSYMLYASTTAGSRGDVVYNSTSLMQYYTITGLLAGTTYYIVLGACTGGGCNLGPPASARTEESAPDGVALPVVTAVSTSELFVTWTPPQFPNGAIVRYNLIQNGVQVFTGLNMSYSSQGLDPYSRHVFRVEACTVRGCASSREVESRTKEAPPVGLIILTAIVADARTVNLSWTAPDKLNGLLVYQVYFTGLFYLDPGNWNYTTVTDRRLLLNVTVPFTLYSVSPLIPMSSYNIQVNGTNSVGFILSNIVGATMPPGTPDGVVPPKLVSDTPRSIQVTWQPVGRVNANETVAYILQFMETTPNAMVQDEYGSVLTLSYTKMNLLPFTEYKFRVVATNSFGRTQSDWASVITKQDKPSSISVPVVTGLKARYIDIMWSPPLSANGIISNYNIYVNGALKSKVAGNVTNQRVDNLAPYTDYMFEVEACTVGGCTKTLPSSTFKTLEDVPEELALPVLKALSPSAIQIVYQTPGKPNGLVTQYIIERKVASSDNATVVTTRVAEMPFLYIDESNSLIPYSVYSYRVNVQNGVGVAVGPWAQITTGASKPAGVNPPQITKLNPTSVLVQWQAPVQSNGQIETYVLRFPEPRIEVRNTTQRQIVVTDLTPYKQYSVTLIACTSGGCTESVVTPLLTDPSIPAGQGAPVPTAISQSRISVLWQPPMSPNGPNITYELSRIKVSQPLDNTVTDIGVWQSVYRGPGLFFEDTNLPMFTTYIYRTTVYNIISQTTSPNSTEATTYGGLPRLPPNVTAVAKDHLSIVVNWTLPSPVDLQGEVQTLTLHAWSSKNNVTVYPDRGQVSLLVDSLQPDTEYSVTLTVTIFGGAFLANPPVLVRTKDGAPSGLNPPQVSIVSTTSLRVSWTAPSQPNGEILAYNILINDRKIPTGSKLSGTAVITNLQPYTVYDIRIEACTVYACTVSKSTLGTTAEALPQGLAAPTAIATTPTQVIVAWRQPDKPNGIIQRYDLWRKTQKSCADLPAPTTNEQLQKCSYVECGILENICGSVCYSGAKVCCNGTIVDSKVGFECCGTNYVYKPRPDYICCSGQFFEPRANFSCCGNRYIEVLPGEICCTDPNEDRVSVSQGDTCCGPMPFSVSGAQFCCQGILMNKLGRKCCGGRVISDSTTCCGSASDGQMYLQQVGYVCCGQEYVESKLTLCCVNDVGYAKTHYYASEQEKVVASDKCCGVNRVTKNLACCNYVGYNQLSQVCADRSRQETGCGTGVVCPLSQQATSYCNRCDFDPSRRICGSVKGALTQPTLAPNSTSTCTTATERIYSGPNLTYTDYNLTPFTQYEYNVIAVNSAGTTSSTFTPVLTLEAAPEEVRAPSTRVAPGELFAIYLTWMPPLKPNGILTSYSLKRDGIELYSGMGTNFTDDLNILPYRSYSYMLTACNNAGCGDSDLITVATAQAMPEFLLPPFVEVINSTQIKIMAQPPGSPNGVILNYSVYIVGSNRVYNSTVPQEFIISDLVPFTSYAIEMKVCTIVGCAVSPNVTVTTSEDLPQGLAAPRIIVISSRIIELYWRAPNVSNGILLGYKVIQTRPAPVTEVYFGNDTNLRLSSMQPGQSYTYQLQVSNRAGVAWSVSREIIMPLVAPLNVPPPQTVRVLSATSIEVKWQPITSDQGDIDGYTVLLNIGLQTEVSRGVGLDTSIVISPLLAYTQYEVRLQACLRNVLNGCGTSSGVQVRTLEDVPLGLAAPKLEAVAANSVQVTWTPPANPNGIITAYRVFQRKFSVNDSEILVNQVAGNVYTFLHSGQDLKPFQVYEYKVLATNSIGQVVSDWSSVRTLESPPVGIAPPVINSISTYGVSVSWAPPQVPNGIIREYRIFYQLTALSSVNSQVYVSVGGNVTSTAVSGLEAFSGYVMSVEAVNGAGTVRSASISFTTREGYPSGLSDFKVEKINTGLSVILSWDVPQKPNGLITGYRIYESTSDVPIYSGVAQQFEFRRLMPYTQYSIRLEACTKVGCSSGKVQPFYTAEIAPSAQPSPVFGNVSSTNIQLSWRPPVNPNGVITSYQVMRLTNALRRRRSVDYASVINPTNANIFIESQAVSQFSFEAYCDNLKTSLLELYIIDEPENDFGVFLDHVDLDDVDVIAMPRIKRQMARSPQVVFQTTDTKQDQYNYTDTGLQPYTSYQYSIRASNSLGSTDSPWQTVTTQQATPDGVQPPKVAYVSGSITSLNVTWSPPAQMNGVLLSYQIQRNNNAPFWFPSNFELQFVDTDLLPYTTYSYKLTVCTGGGCTSSEPTTIRTLEASPFLVSPPQLEALNSTAIKATWSKPQITNGEITGYKLKMDRIIVYSGLDQTFIISKLAPYESYVFTLTACTNGGCTESGEVSERTLDAPPAGLSPPLLRVLSSNSIEITWSAPANPNGVISTYYLRRSGTLIYISNIEASGNIVMTKIDDSLVPGEEYSYTVEAVNRRGSVESGAAKAVTYSSSPTGLAPPTVTPLSATSIQVDWTPPSNPNGQIISYAIYEGANKVYTGEPGQLSYVVPGLQYYTQYSFRVEACTNRGCQVSQPAMAMTREAKPEGQPPPTLLALGDEQGAHAGVRVSWENPSRANGNITGYEVQRRSVLNGSVFGEPFKAYSGTERQFTDTSSELRPFSQYQYMAVAANSVGKAESVWASVITKEAPPQDVLPPIVNSSTAYTITVTIPQPKVTNGIIGLYKILVNNTMRSSSPSAWQIIGLSPPLLPYSPYELKAQVCTSGGCGTSVGVIAWTASAKPTGLAPIRVRAVTNDSATLEWSPPESPNGQILRYEVYMRKSCPPTVQPFNQTCHPGDVSTVYSGLNLSTTVSNLDPYTAYSFQLQTFNEIGGVDFPNWLPLETKEAMPLYVQFPKLMKNGTLAEVDWSNSFMLNSYLREYTLQADGITVFRGISTVGGVERANKNQAISFTITLVTNTGRVESPVIVFDPSAVDNIGTTTPATVIADKSTKTAVYEEVWFIVLMCILALLILFVVLAICVRRTGSKQPYIRERMPLQRQAQRNMPRGLYVIDATDGSVIDATGLSPSRRNKRDHFYHGPGVGIINPAFAEDRSMGKLTLPNPKYIDDEDLRWGQPYDSGLFDDMDDDSSSGHTYSYTKEQTVFTDTHL